MSDHKVVGALLTAVILVVSVLTFCIVTNDSDEQDDLFRSMDYVSLGDSITSAVDGKTHRSMVSPYPCLVTKELGFKSHLNLAVGGATVSDVRPDNNVLLQMDRIPSGTDVISVLIGGNDFLAGVPLGDIDDSSQDTVYGGFNLLVKGLKDRFPQAYIFFMTQFDVPCAPGANGAGYTMYDLGEVVKTVCSSNSIPVLDLYHLVDFTMETDPECDMLHPTQAFVMNNIAPKVSEFIRSNHISGQKYVALGDSITYGHAMCGRMSHPYPSLVGDRLGISDVVNLAVSGATVSGLHPNNNTMLQLEQVPLDADIISVMIGVNDFGNNVPLGDIDDRTQDTVYGGLNLLADGLLAKCPDAFLFFMTPFPFLSMMGDNSAGYSVSDVADAVKDVCSQRGILVLDMYEVGCFTMENDPACDTLHPTERFFRKYTAPIIERFIKENYRY